MNAQVESLNSKTAEIDGEFSGNLAATLDVDDLENRLKKRDPVKLPGIPVESIYRGSFPKGNSDHYLFRPCGDSFSK